jgi:hypothetical protein
MFTRTIAILLLGLMLVTTAVASRCAATSHGDIRKLLTSLQNVKDDREALAALFKTGDARIAELIEALHDPDLNVRLRAQIVIRYLGNETGMKALEDWYSKQAEVVTSGPIPLPLKERDYEFIKDQYLNKPAAAWAGADQYIYALALDGSPKAKALLHELMKSAGTIDDFTVGGRAIRLTNAGDAERVLIGQRDLAKLVSENAFFIAANDRPFTSAKLLSLNGAKDKALIELYINRGRLAEEWYHIVLSKHGQGWKFFSIRQVAVS